MLAINVLFFVTSVCFADDPCAISHSKPHRKFYKIKNCYRSSLPIIARANAKSLTECVEFANDREGLAINFSPLRTMESAKFNGGHYFENCQILGCPEGYNSSTLVKDRSFDYYSMYGDLSVLEKYSPSCIKSIGLFVIFEEKANYTDAILYCQNVGGDLADIVSETRTIGISSLIDEKLEEWYKIAYVGLEDIMMEGHFTTPLGESINCFKFRAWGPGQPRNFGKHHDCVVVDTENAWKVVDCREKLPFVCELYSMARQSKSNNFKHNTCANIEDKELRKQCHNYKQMYSSRRTTNRCQNEYFD